MKPYEAAALIALAVLLVLVWHFIAAKGEKRRLTIVNSQGKPVAVDAEIARDGATMAKGLMGRGFLGKDEGMLFVFSKSGRHSFWMLNTTISLDAIHFSENGTVVDIITMEPCGWNVTKCRSYYPAAPSRYVLEVNSGFAALNRIAVNQSTLDLAALSEQ